ncbi:hypothetical protein A3Q56_04526 [Intoshia linei]|uniref:C2 domain-containing protein n=1 Tax=Intoshia linei TaxID=1819745 RepID=A0A177B204_9BILA|nr:hypothetical protein A3Q56_04526 [Intoshia linei]
MYTTKNKPLDTTLDLTIFYNTKGKMSKTSEDPPLEEVEIEDNTKEIVTVENGIPIKKPKKEKIITNNNREKFSNGAQDFQIKIKIIEAKNLFGSNISPLTVVTYANMHKRTKIIKSNNNPKWNEIIYFNVNKKATDLFDDVLKIKVVNSKKFRKNSVIGEFKCDIGRIVDQDSMCFINKWIALVDPEMSQSSSKGYLKICSAVISSKFSAPKFPESNMNDDVENNLLIPTGVVFETISLSIRIFDAEDLPTMDSSIMGSIKKTILGKETKPFCDPFLLCSFGGFAKKTPIFYNTYNPSWNCQINFSIKFPSMCDFLKIQLYDWDQIGKNDLIATSMLRLSDLSDLGDEENEGYPPTFGPAFVNFYGGPRKFNISSDDYDDMNNAITEGCGYRGRVFMEIQTNINENSITEVPPEDVNINHKYKSKSEFVLNAVLFNASLLKKIGEPITVEISIGNYGNSLDPLVLPSNSTSQPMGTIYDGSKYYFLPWENENPIFRIICEWEDVVHRLYTINFFLKASIIIEEKLSILNKELKKLKISRINRRQSYTEHSNSVCLLIADLAELVISIFNEKLPTCGENGHTTLNNLDQVLYQKRCFEMKHIVYQANEILKKTTKITKDEDLTWLIKELKSINTKIIYLTQDPQNQIPDIIFWIIAGKERISYARFPAHSFIYHQNEIFRGSNCGIVKTILLKKPIKNTSSITRHITGILRCQMWFGLVNQENNWIDVLAKQGSVTVTAETVINLINFYESSIILSVVDKIEYSITPFWAPFLKSAPQTKGNDNILLCIKLIEL